MKRNFSLLFFLKKGKTDHDGNCSIYMRITIEKKRVDLATGKQCADNDWLNGKIVGSSAHIKSINLYPRDISASYGSPTPIFAVGLGIHPVFTGEKSRFVKMKKIYLTLFFYNDHSGSGKQPDL